MFFSVISMGEPHKMRSSFPKATLKLQNLKLIAQLLQWVVWCKNVSKTKNHTSVLVQYNLHVMRQQSKTTIVTITTEPCIRPSCSHFVPDTAVQSSLRNLFSAIRHYFCFYQKHSVIQGIKYCSGFQSYVKSGVQSYE